MSRQKPGAAPKAPATFEELWSSYLKNPHRKEALELNHCLLAARTFMHAELVYLATTVGRSPHDFYELGDPRRGALKRMIELASTHGEATRALAYASSLRYDRRKPTLRHPTRHREALAKVMKLTPSL